ncbi:hypothetical protein WJX74_003086 [Apatococcus lobatus]|uniref:Uncharacterized protein n=1 Tax=Apatococcus lobatus TaxID=904363 RepID=A0AAW1Q8U9_9CHLO
MRAVNWPPSGKVSRTARTTAQYEPYYLDTGDEDSDSDGGMPTLQESDDDSEESEDDDAEPPNERTLEHLKDFMRRHRGDIDPSHGKRPETPGLKRGFLARPPSSASSSSRSAVSSAPGLTTSAQAKDSQGMCNWLKAQFTLPLLQYARESNEKIMQQCLENVRSHVVSHAFSMILAGGSACACLPYAQASVYAAFLTAFARIMRSQLADGNLLEAGDLTMRAGCVTSGAVKLLRAPFDPDIKRPHLLCKLVGQTLGRLVNQGLLQLNWTAQIIAQHQASLSPEHLTRSTVYKNSWQTLLFMLECVHDDKGLPFLEAKWFDCNVDFRAQLPKDLCGNSTSNEAKVLKEFGFEKLEPLLRFKPPPAEGVRIWQSTLQMLHSANGDPPAIVEEGLDQRLAAFHIRMNPYEDDRGSGACSIDKSGSVSVYVNPDLPPGERPAIPDFFELQNMGIPIEQLDPALRTEQQSIADTVEMERVQQKQTEKNRKKRHKRKAKAAAERQAVQASDASPDSPSPELHEAGAQPLVDIASLQYRNATPAPLGAHQQGPMKPASQQFITSSDLIRPSPADADVRLESDEEEEEEGGSEGNELQSATRSRPMPELENSFALLDVLDAADSSWAHSSPRSSRAQPVPVPGVSSPQVPGPAAKGSPSTRASSPDHQAHDSLVGKPRAVVSSSGRPQPEWVNAAANPSNTPGHGQSASSLAEPQSHTPQQGRPYSAPTHSANRRAAPPTSALKPSSIQASGDVMGAHGLHDATQLQPDSEGQSTPIMASSDEPANATSAERSGTPLTDPPRAQQNATRASSAPLSKAPPSQAADGAGPAAGRSPAHSSIRESTTPTRTGAMRSRQGPAGYAAASVLDSEHMQAVALKGHGPERPKSGPAPSASMGRVQHAASAPPAAAESIPTAPARLVGAGPQSNPAGVARPWRLVVQDLNIAKSTGDVAVMEAAIKKAVVWLSTAAGLQAPGVAQMRGALKEAKEWTRRVKQASHSVVDGSSIHGQHPGQQVSQNRTARQEELYEKSSAQILQPERMCNLSNSSATSLKIDEDENLCVICMERKHSQAQQVREHRVKSVSQRQQRIAELGPCPDTSQEQTVWDKRKQEVEQQLELELQSERLVTEGLEDAWEKFQEREKLKKLREQLLESGAANGSLPLPAGPGSADAAPWDGLYITPLQGGGWQPQPGIPSSYQPPESVPSASDVPIKLCRRCNQQKPVTDFYHSRANADGYDGRCKACDAVQCAMRRKKKPRIENPTVSEKPCRRCGLMKPQSNFYRNKTNADGLYNNCKACFTEDAQLRRERLAPLEERTVSHKTCKRCNEDKPSSEFYRNRLMADGLYSHCKSCYSAAATERSEQREVAPEKQCRRCRETKRAVDFYQSKMTADGLQSYCKACYASAAATRRRQNASSRADPDSDLPGDLSPEQLQHMQGGAGLLMTGLEGMNLGGPLGQLQPHEALAHMAGHLPHMVSISSHQMQMPHMIQMHPVHDQMQMLQIPASQLPQLPSLGQSLPQLTSLGHLSSSLPGHSGGMQPQPYHMGVLHQSNGLRMQQVPVSLPEGMTSMSAAGSFMKPEGPTQL